MQDSLTATFKGQSITVKELTVKQVREVFDRLDKDPVLFIDDLLDQPVPGLIVVESTGLKIEDLEEAKPSELIPLCSEVLRANPSCASMIRRRIEAAKKMEGLLLSVQNLTGLSAQ